MYFSTAVVAAFAASVNAATQQVLVGANNGLTFTPSQIQAQPGDQVQFVFQNANHTATQGTMNAACQPAANGFASGFAPVNTNPTNPATINGTLTGNAFLVTGNNNNGKNGKNGKNGANNNGNANANANPQTFTQGPATFTVNVADTNPIPVYCNQQLHCQQGMVAMINGNNAQLQQYAAMAANANANVIAPGPLNGQVSGYTPNQQATTNTNKNGNNGNTNTGNTNGKKKGANPAANAAAAIQNAIGGGKGN